MLIALFIYHGIYLKFGIDHLKNSNITTPTKIKKSIFEESKNVKLATLGMTASPLTIKGQN